MAKSTDTSTTFRTLALATAGLLVAAGALVYLGQGSPSGSAGAGSALIQAVPAQSRAALSGETGAFDALVATERQLAATLAGSGGNGQALAEALGRIASDRQILEAAADRSVQIRTAATEARVIADQLLDRSGATAIVQESGLRLDSVRRIADGMLLRSNFEAELAALRGHVDYLVDVSNGLAGRESTLDLSPLNDAGQEQVVAPFAELVSTLQSGVDALSENAAQLASTAATQSQIDSAARRLLGTGVGGSTGLPDLLSSPWLPLSLIIAAVLLVLGMIAINARLGKFEAAATAQAEQHERNQQAILRLLDEMGSLADGDLTVEATVSEDITGTIADSFNFAIEELRKLVATVNETAIMVDTASKQTENTAAHMARAAETQTREISAATQSIVSMAGSIEEVSGNAERSSDVARHSVEVAHKGGEAVRRTIDGMNTIRETIQETSKRIKRLGESSQEIGNIVELINDIAEQTNILALNASIQASMAGEAGRGFAVVADEVQRLAERSTNATKQIEVLVSTIQADTKEAVVSMERSTTDVVGGALLAENAGAALDEIEQVSNQIASLVQNISSSAREQASTAADVTKRTTRLSEISEQTGKATTATAAAISKLSEFASQLRQSVAGFTLPQDLMQGGTLVTRAPNAPPQPPAASAGPAKPVASPSEPAANEPPGPKQVNAG